MKFWKDSTVPFLHMVKLVQVKRIQWKNYLKKPGLFLEPSSKYLTRLKARMLNTVSKLLSWSCTMKRSLICLLQKKFLR
ncbi:hypothetical protein LINPERHAP1_LOCUS12121 [Linum perenne]